jgi:hypothetical protein
MSGANHVLELDSFHVDRARRGPGTGWSDGVLQIDVDGLEAQLSSEPGLAAARISIVQPAEPVRIVNVLDVVEPAVKVDDPAWTFPGMLGEARRCGYGATNRLDGLAVIATADLRASHAGWTQGLPDSVIDMAGPAAELTPWSRTTNVVAEFDPEPSAHFENVDGSIRRAVLRLARDLAATTLGAEPTGVEELALPRIEAPLPSVCVMLQIAAEGPGADTCVYGAPAHDDMPRVIDPREILDGALTAASYDWPGVRDATYSYQRSELIRGLMAAHGDRLRFAGVVLTLGYLNTAEEKRRMAADAAELARSLGADGAILTTFSSGNSHTDTMLTVQACERLGVRTTALVAETNGGLTDHVREADSIVSVGNEDQMVEAWQPERVIGGSRLRAGHSAAGTGPVAAVHYLGALSESGQMSLRAVPA